MNVQAILAAKGTDVVSIAPERTLAEAVALLASRRIGALVVSAGGGRLAGILSERDIVRALAAAGAEALASAVGDHMTTTVATTTDEEPMPSLMERMTEGRFRHMPVMADGRVVGVVSIGDVVKHRVAEIEAEAHAMREYIQAG
ncbi:MAG TPA: CBS domain-containing protein [Hyphomicrobiales bacterium]|nr:CBS domain-containing protein [Hyphomicrobiales bacterium]